MTFCNCRNSNLRSRSHPPRILCTAKARRNAQQSSNINSPQTAADILHCNRLTLRNQSETSYSTSPHIPILVKFQPFLSNSERMAKGIRVKSDDEFRIELRRSPRVRTHNKAVLRENCGSPNLKSESVLRRSPRIGKLKDANLVLDPKTPNMKSGRKQARLSRDRISVLGLACGSAGVVKGVGEVKQTKGGGKSNILEMNRTTKFCSKLGAFEKNSNAEVNADGGGENLSEERVGLRRSPRFLNQQKDYKEVDQKLDFVLDESCGKDCGSGCQSGKNTVKKSVSVLGSEEELFVMGEEASWKSEGKGDEVGSKKRKRGKENKEVMRGWTKEQEMTLGQAYMAMKPTPSFWKKVSKMVGKSAQECFDRINYNQQTPVAPKIRSRIKRKTSPLLSNLSLSASKLLGSPNPARKRKTKLGQKKVRELLHRHCNIEKDYEGDLFSVLEGDRVSSPLKVSHMAPGASTPPAPSLRKGSNSFSARKKSVSRFAKAVPLVSPPVLKQVKNKALHEKYIDQLHIREAKRKAELTRAKRTTIEKENLAPNCSQNPSMLQAAKNALETDARDVILQFKALNNSSSETEDDILLSNDENEDELL